jgi:hypothetical protein
MPYAQIKSTGRLKIKQHFFNLESACAEFRNLNYWCRAQIETSFKMHQREVCIVKIVELINTPGSE